MAASAKRIFGTMVFAGVISAAALGAQAPAAAQPPAQGQRGGAPAAPPFDPAAVSQVSAETFREQMVDPGVFYAVVMDRPDVRIGHTRLAPGGARARIRTTTSRTTCSFLSRAR